MLMTVIEKQRADGSWGVLFVWEPLGSTPEVITTLVLLSLTSPNAPDLGEAGKAAQAKGLAWLLAAKTDETLQSWTLKLLLFRRLGRPVEEQQPIARRIIGMQKSDGGWGQTADLPSDAYSTGQLLYVLVEGGVPVDDPAIARGRAFLVKTQELAGSWAMTSRPGGPRGESATDVAPISYAGTAWAVMGLMRSTPLLSSPATSTPQGQ
jgi:hypothetical protein